MDRRSHRLATGFAGKAGWVGLALIPAAFLLVFFLLPTANLVGRGFFDGEGWTLSGFGKVFSRARTWRIVSFTLSTAAIATLLCVLLGIPGAYILYRVKFPGQRWLRTLAAIPFVLPTVVVGVAFGVLLRTPMTALGLDGSYWAILAAMVFFNYSVIVRTTGTMWERIDRRLGWAARTLGASPWRVFWTVTLPALVPAIAAGASLVFLFCSTAFGIVMVLGGVEYSTIETEIWYLTTQLLDLRGAAALSIAQLVVVAVTLFVTNTLQRQSRRALPLTDDTSYPLSWQRDAPALLLTLLLLAGLAAPIVALLIGSLRRGGEWTLANYAALSETAGLAVPVPIWHALGNSIWIALAATVIALVLGVLVSLVASRRPTTSTGRRFLAWLEGAFLLPLGVSAVTLGFGYLITLNRPPLDLRSSLVLVPIAQALVALPLVVRSLLPSLRALDVGQLEAARTLGSSPWQVVLRIELPVLLRGLGLAAGFALATSLGEFGATAFLARPDNPTLPVVIYRLFGRPGSDNYGMALAAATILAGLTAVVMAWAERLRPKGVSAW